MFGLQGQITGDPDFDLLRITAGSGFGLPSPGHTTLTRQGPPGSGWAVDSFFDISYRIDFVGAAGSPRIGGMSGSTTGTIRMVAVRPPPPPTVTEAESFFPIPVLPPTNGLYLPPPLTTLIYPGGIIISNVQHRSFTGPPLVPPPLGATQTHSFGSQVEFLISRDGGVTFQPGSGSANVTVQVTHTQDYNGTSFYDTEMLQLDLSASTGSSSIMLRESPTLQSKGQTTVRPVAGGFMISSFFDVFSELSLDGGVNWQPAQGPRHHVRLRKDPRQTPPVPEPTPLLPPPNDHYVSPAQWHALYAQGIVIKDVSHRLFTQSLPPPPAGGSSSHSFNSQLDLRVSTDGGTTFQSVRATAPVQVMVSDGGGGTFDTEMLSLNLSTSAGGRSIMIRESPTEPSRGGTRIEPQADGTFRINSFFDIFTEVSLDGGISWQGASNGPVRMELKLQAPEAPKPSPNLPPSDGSYISPAKWHALYANGIIITNVTHRGFLQSLPPPPPGGGQTHQFDSVVDFQVSMDGGATFVNHSAPAQVMVRVDSSMDSGMTRYFNTEMLQLNISGGDLGSGVMIRESPTLVSPGRTSVRTESGGLFDISSFFDIFTELSLDGGRTWSPAMTEPGTVALNPNPTPPFAPFVIYCPSNITVTATGPGGTVVNYIVTFLYGDCPFGPYTVTCTPPSGSTFPIGTTTVNCVGSNGCGEHPTCSFTVTVLPPVIVRDFFFPLPILPPTNAMYINPFTNYLRYGTNIVIRNVRHRRFSLGLPPPPLGQSQTHSFTSEVDFDLSLDAGVNFVPGVQEANCTVRVTHTQDSGGKSFFDTEMLQLDLSGGGIMLRESPTLQSPGQTTVRPVAGGYMISSFFDINTEVSLDGGATWQPAQGPAHHVELRKDPRQVPPVNHPTPLLPPPNGGYVSPAQYHALYAQGIVIKDVSHKYFTDSQPPPPPQGTRTHQFSSQVDMQLSTDGGQTFRPARAPAAVMVRVDNIGSSGQDGYLETEMLQLNLQGGDLPPGVMIRESPTEPSRGATQINPQADGTFHIGSFFDIFTELSVDGGQTWQGSSNGPVQVQLSPVAPEVPKPTPNLPPPDGQYISPAKWHALYANGIIITNASHKRFLQSFPPPPPGGSQVESTGSTVEGQVSMNGGASFSPFSAPAAMQVQVSSTMDAGNTRYFNTEMLALNISGGSLPGGIMVRESPSKQSLGRTSVRTDAADYKVSSFFDIFTEVSLDGGQTWSPSTTAPGGMTLGPQTNNPPPLRLACSSNITVTATSSNGAVVFYTSSASGGCPPGTPTVTCNPPSGSTFPVGTTTVTCIACDPCGVCTNCSFTVTVNPIEVDYFPNTYAELTLQKPDGSTEVVALQGPTTVHVQIATNGATADSNGNGLDDAATEMVSMNLSGNSSMGPVTVNLNPGIPTLGMIEETANATPGILDVPPFTPGGTARSFFDVFPEIHVGAQTLHPATAIHMEAIIKHKPPGPGDTYTNVFTQPVDLLDANGTPTGIKIVREVHIPRPVEIDTFPNTTAQVTLQKPDGSTEVVNLTGPTTVHVLIAPNGGTTDSNGNGLDDAATEMVSMNLSGNSSMGGVQVHLRPGFQTLGQIEETSNTQPGRLDVPPFAPGGTANSFFDVFIELQVNNGPPLHPQTPLHLTSLIHHKPPAPGDDYVNPFTQPVPLLDANGNPTGYSMLAEVHTPNPRPLSVVCSSNRTVTATSAAGAVVTYPPPTVSGGCPPYTVNCNPPSGSTFPIGTTTVTCSACDACGNCKNCTFTVTVNPPPPINLTCSSNLTVTATSSNGAVVFYSSSASGGCSPPPFLSCNPPSGSTFPIGTTTVTCTASDGCGTSTNCSFTVTVTRPPINLTCSSNLTVTATSSSGAVVFYSSSASGGCSPPPSLVCNPPSGSTFPIGTTTVTCMASDGCGQSTNCSFTVTVSPPQPISLICSSNKTVAATSAAGAVVTYSSSASGGIPPVGVWCNPPSGSTFPIGTTTVTCTATDACGNTTNCGFTVTVVRLVITIQPVGNQLQLSWPTGTLQESDEADGPYIDVDPQPTSPTTVTPTEKRKFYRVRVGEPGFTYYDTELLQLDISGGGLPPGMRLRESPTLQSLGKTAISPRPDGGFVIHSFFDVFTEVSLDNGQNWSASTSAPPRMRFTGNAPTNTVPPRDSQYVSPAQWHALYAQGIVITNASHLGFLGSFPPPPPGGVSDTHSFGSTVNMMVRQCPTCPPQAVSAPANVTVRMTSRP